MAALAAPSSALAQADGGSVGYPEIRIPSTDGDIPLGVGVGPNGGGLALHLTWGDGRPGRGLPATIANPSNISVRLHVGDETVVAAPAERGWVGIGKSGITTYQLILVFPWQRNAMDEGWFEVTAGGVTNWIEVPYGLVRDPAATKIDGSVRGSPRFPKSMADLGDRDTLVPWRRVGYHFGEIHDRARLWLDLVNGEWPRIETMLHRDAPERGLFAGTMDQPIVSATIELSGGRSLPGLPSARKLHQDGVRDDEFTFGLDWSPEREWGTIVVRVDDRAYSVRVPSSLFKRFHGVTDPGNPRRMRVPRR